MSRRAWVLLALCFLAMGCKQPPVTRPTPWLTLHVGKPLKEGSFEECVAMLVAGGMKPADALRACGELRSPPGVAEIPIGGVPLDFGPFSEPPSTTPQASPCTEQPPGPAGPFAGTGSTGYGPNYGDPTQRPLTKQEQQEAIREIQERLNAARMKEAEAEKARDDAFEAWQQARERNNMTPADSPDKAKTEKEAKDLGDFYMQKFAEEWDAEEDRKDLEQGLENPPTHTLPLVATPTRDAVALCEEVARFLDECNQNQWRGDACSTFLSGIGKCADPRLVRTDGETGQICRLPAVSGDEAERALAIACDAGRRRPVPGQDPCKVVIEDAQIVEYFTSQPFGSTPGNLCGDPRAWVEPEACVGTFTIVAFGEPNIQNLIKFGREKFGGPLIVIPVPQPEPSPAPGPDPRPVPPQ